MSGPKVSKAELDRMRQIEVQKKKQIMCEIKNKERIVNNFDIRIIDSDIHEKLAKKFEIIRKRYYKSLNELSKESKIKMEIDKLERINENSETILRKFEKSYDTVFKKIEENINKLSQNEIQEIKMKIIHLVDEIPEKGETETEIVLKNVEKNINKLFKVNNKDVGKIKNIEFQEIKLEKHDRRKIFSFSMKNKKVKKNEEISLSSSKEIEQNTEEILDKLYDFMKSDKYTIEDRQKFLYMEKEILDIKEEKGITLEIKKLLILEKKENIETNLKRIEVNNKEVEFLYDDYLKEAYYINHQSIKSIREFSSKEDIKSEIEILRKKGEEISKREYIKEQLDEVMLKHGYNVIDSEHIEKVKEDNRLLYEIDDSTGIDVFLSETQTQMVTLKIVGIGFDEEITERESDRLYEEQCNFCSMFPELVEELRIRGVILNEVRYNEANKKYNSKIKIKKNDKTKNKKKKSRENINNKKYREIKR
jgi:hypothetical protein